MGVAAALASSPPPTVHAILERSTPAAGDTLDVLPVQITLSFSGPVEETGAVLRVLGPSDRIWDLVPRRAAGDARTLVADMPPLETGGYRLEWRVISADGHPVGDDFVFYVGGPGGSGGGELGQPPPHRMDAGGSHAGMAGSPHIAPRLIVIRVLADLALLPLAGLLLFAAWARGSVTDLTGRATRLLAVAAPVLAVAYAWLWAGETLGQGGARLDGLLSLTTGRALTGESALALLVPWALLLARRTELAAVFAILAVAAGGLGGHPASYTPAVTLPASVAHVVASAVWVGGLLFLVTERGGERHDLAARRVSGAALLSVVVVAVTGIVQSWTILGSLGRLLSPFGLVLLAKTVGFAGLIAFGAYHRFRLLPSLQWSEGPPEGSVRLSRSVAKELALATCVVALAALLSHIPPTS